MSKDGYVCPKCRADLTAYRCQECRTDIRELFAMPGRLAKDAVLAALAQAGAFVERSTQMFLVPGHREWRKFTFDPTHPSRSDVCNFISLACHLCPGIIRSKFKPADAEDTLMQVAMSCPDMFPRVDTAGDKPQLYLDPETDQLIWPFTHDSPRSRLYDNGQFGLLYEGPIFVPRRTGAFEEFLATLRCSDDEDRLSIKQWMLGGLGQPLIPPGQIPLLLLCSDNFGAGKSSTMRMLAHYLGGFVELTWNQHIRPADVSRQIMDYRNRLVILDNVEPDDGSPVFSSPHLAGAVTAQQISVKTLYKTLGNTTVPNRLLWAATANNPQFASELLNRSTVATLSVERDQHPGWITHWQGRRQEVVEDMLQLAMDNWALGPMPPPRKPCRFLEWQRVVQRMSREEPVIIPSTSIVSSPLVALLDDYWAGHNPGRRLAWKALQAFLAAAQTPLARVVKAQQSCTWNNICFDLLQYPNRYIAEDECIVRTAE